MKKWNKPRIKLTTEELEDFYPWIKACKYKDGEFYILNSGYGNILEYNDGEWLDGVWKAGYMNNIKFHNGTMERHSYFNNGIWHNGCFKGMEIYKSSFENGVFEQGFFVKSNFLNGRFEHGVFVDSIWHDGFFNNENSHCKYKGNTYKKMPTNMKIVVKKKRKKRTKK